MGRRYKPRTVLVTLLACIVLSTHAQDTTKRMGLTRRVWNRGLKALYTHPADTIENEASQNPFLPHAGRVIRKIDVTHIGFERSLYDSSRRVTRWISRAANALHVDTRVVTLRKHLIFKEGDRVNPYLLADNERYLRDRDFLQDSRIVVTPVNGTDSVDILVITRDIFSLGSTVGGSFPGSVRFGVSDINVNGRAQEVRMDVLYDTDRSPQFGTAYGYRKSSLFGTFTDLELEYTELNDGQSMGGEIEYATRLVLERPLVSNYSRIAGGLEMSRNWSKNVYNKSDLEFLDYEYKIFDTWIGYNLGINKGIRDGRRHFVSFRYFDGYYDTKPDQEIYKDDRTYNSSFGYLGAITFYNERFYRTRYVYGFGMTEDIPAGLNLSLLGGYIQFLDSERPYASFRFSYNEASKTGGFYTLRFETEAYNRSGTWEDKLIQVGATFFTRARSLGTKKIRTTYGFQFTQLIDHFASPWPDIGRPQIPGFNSELMELSSRVSLHGETTLFTNLSLIGFRMAPYLGLDLVATECVTCPDPTRLYAGFTAGLRTRNENLVFGTVEFRLTYIPHDELGNPKLDFGVRQRLRFKSTGSYIQAPALIRY